MLNCNGFVNIVACAVAGWGGDAISAGTVFIFPLPIVATLSMLAASSEIYIYISK